MRLITLLQSNIKKLTLPLKNEDELVFTLKRRLTKKEYKILMLMAKNLSKKEQIEKLALDENRYEEIRKKIFKKINSQKIKEELIEPLDEM